MQGKSYTHVVHDKSNYSLIYTRHVIVLRVYKTSLMVKRVLLLLQNGES